MRPGADQTVKRLYEFGPFRVDPEKELLHRDGETVPLTPKTFQILLVLMRHSQEVVTKDDLLKTVWPDTFVEEANLSRNIFLLRKALGETPQDHQYIVTVPGRGYRFAEDVQLVADRELNIIAASHSKIQLLVHETKPWGWISVAAVLLISVAGAGYRLFTHRAPTLTTTDTVVLADFANSTGDPIFDGTLRQGLSVQLEQSPFLSLISDERIQHMLRLMDKPADTRLTPELAHDVCERTGSAAVLDGSVARLGSEYVLGLRVINCHSGEVLDQEQEQVARKEDVLKGLDHVASRFRTHVGESLGTLAKHNAALEDATTASLDALRAYSNGWRIAFSAGYADAVPFFKRATELDPKFAMAYASLARMYGDIGESALSSQNAEKAYLLRDHATDRERFFITVSYDRQLLRNLEKAREELGLWTQTYPRDTYAHSLLSGFTSQGAGNYARSIEEAQKAIALDPDFTPAYINLATSYFYLDHFKEASSVLQRATERRLEIPDAVVLSYYIAFLTDDQDGVQRAIVSARGNVSAEDWILHSQALVLARSGQLQAANRMSAQAVELAEQNGQIERAATFLAGRAVWEALFGNVRTARQDATRVLKIADGRDVEYAASLALALAGDDSQALALANDLAHRFPEDTSVKFNYIPTLRALSALQRNHPENAVELLDTASPYDFAVPGIDFFAFFGGPYPAYARGKADLASRHYTKAASEFKAILDHRGLLAADPIGALTTLELARACYLSGDKDGAKAAYQDLLTFWNGADADLPVLKQARTEYAALQ